MPRVVVLGAGTAGLTVAKQLSSESNFEVVILEALDRIGGRVKSVGLKGAAAQAQQQRADIGASWMHETRVNPLFTVALEKKWKIVYDDVNIQTANKQGVIPQLAGIAPIFEDLQAQIEDYVVCEPTKKTDNISVLQFAQQRIAEMPLISEEQKRLALQACREIEHFVGMPLSEIPLSDGILSHVNGRDAFMLGRGYVQVIDWIWDSIDHKKTDLRLNEEVLRVEEKSRNNESGRSKFLVTTTKSQYEADYVVCTIPIGALKECHSRLFGDLNIPEVVRAIEKTNMAALGKVVLEFPHVFWDEARDATFVINESNNSAGISPESVTVVTPFKGIPALIFLTSPPLTQKVESDPQNAFEYVKWAFKHLGNTDVPEPTNVLVSDWTQNRFFRGSYSARSIGQSHDELVDAFIDGMGQLGFAGEHTVLEGNGCVHAAYNSGMREAHKIIQMEKQK